jgi:CelD/BcsL family acetyltransferase involved in cellulose biosynthesis
LLPHILCSVEIALVTEAARLRDYVEGWEALADARSMPRAGGGLVTAWAEHMMDPDAELRVWIATEGPHVLGVLPFVAEPMPRGVRLVAPSTNLIYGVVPIAEPDREAEIVGQLVDEFARHADGVQMATLYWLPAGSPWSAAFVERFEGPDWVIAATSYVSHATTIGNGVEAWLDERSKGFRKKVHRRSRRYEEEGFRRETIEDPTEIARRLPRLRQFYLGTEHWAKGEGYQFDESMVRTIETAMAYCPQGRFALSVVERDDLLIGVELALRAGDTMSTWLTGYDAEWSRFSPGTAARLEAFDAGARSGIMLADLGVGDEAYKSDLHDGNSGLQLETVVWCRPRLARMMMLQGLSNPDGGAEALS